MCFSKFPSSIVLDFRVLKKFPLPLVTPQNSEQGLVLPTGAMCMLILELFLLARTFFKCAHTQQGLATGPGNRKASI